MNFASVPFVLVFLPVFVCLYLFVRPSIRLVLVLLASILFLATGQWIALPWLLGLGLVGYALGILIASRLERGRKASFWLWLGIGLNLGILLAFKLLVIYNPESMLLGGFSLSQIVMPLGLSYFAFQTIGYLVNIAQENIQVEKNLFRFITYVLFFPKVAAGPITKYQDFARQTDSLKPAENDIVSGLGRIFIGEIKTIFIARTLGLFVNPIFSQPQADIEPGLAWLVLIASFLQIYFDFSGYTDIAIGLGRVIGIQLPENFNYPFISQSISDFWRRWHMTLIAWFREYVFYPLERRRLPVAGQQINLLVIFLLTGLWHGPTLNYILWGSLQGLAIVFETTTAGKWWLRTAWRPLRRVYTLAIVLLSWVFFRSTSLPFAFKFFSRLAGNRAGLDSSVGAGLAIEPSLLIVLLIALVFSLPVTNPILEWLKKSAAVQQLVLFSQQNSAFGFIWENKRLWLTSMAAVLAVFGTMLVLLETAAPAQFIYAGF